MDDTIFLMSWRVCILFAILVNFSCLFTSILISFLVPLIRSKALGKRRRLRIAFQVLVPLLLLLAFLYLVIYGFHRETLNSPNGYSLYSLLSHLRLCPSYAYKEKSVFQRKQLN